MSSSNLFYKHKQFHIQNIYHFFDMFNEYLMLLKWSIFSSDTWSFYHKDSGVYVPFCTVIVPSVVLKVDTGTEICKKEKKVNIMWRKHDIDNRYIASIVKTFKYVS